MILKDATSPSDRVIYQVRNFGFEIFQRNAIVEALLKKNSNKQKILETVTKDRWNGGKRCKDVLKLWKW